ncbi:hypothetical protein J7K44_00020 [bacterium]|nr:hypothetical protein [bacterium]
MIVIKSTPLFESELFNEINSEYFNTLIPNLMRYYMIKSAKGSSLFQDYYDMPYHIHILNGLLPASLLLESEILKSNKMDYPDLEKYLKIFYVGFTFHDINKLVEINDLRDAVDQKLIEECEKLDVNEFFPEWRDYLNEIKYLILGTEEGTRNYVLPLNVTERELLNELSEYTQLADKLSSIQFKNCNDFYKKLQRLLFKGYKRLGEFLPLSYVYLNKNIHTLLSKKLLKIISNYIVNEKQQKIIFYLKDGIIFQGEPLDMKDIKIIKNKMTNPLKDTDFYITSTKIDHQQIDFGFLNIIPLNKNILKRICEYYIRTKTNSIFYIQNEECIKEKITNFFDDLEVPLTIKTKGNKIFVVLEEKWHDLDEVDKKLLLSICMQKIEFLKLKDNKKWRNDFIEIEKEYMNIKNRPSRVTLCTLDYMTKKLAKKEINEIYEDLSKEICDFFNSRSNPIQIKEMVNDFVDRNLRGNFKIDIKMIDKKLEDPPKKDRMCVICGNPASILANESVCFGFRSRSFNNRSVNTLKNKDTYICDLCLLETLLRKTEYPKSIKSNVCIYIDIGDYFVNMDRRQFIKILQKILGEGILKAPETLTLEIQKIDVNFDFHSVVFYPLSQDIKSNYFFIRKLLKIIEETGFKIYVSDIMTPFTYKKEMFCIETVLPFIRKLRWNKLRIDEVKNAIKEIELIGTIWGNQEVSCLLDYSKEKISIFSYFSRLDRNDKYFNSRKKRLYEFVKENKEVFKLDTMEKIVEKAIDIRTLRYNESGSQETWMIREALDILKLGIKEGKQEDTVISQIAGAIYKRMKGDPYCNITAIQNFSKSVYKDLFENEWKGKIPKPHRLKHWIYQFAFLYRVKSDEKWEEVQKNKKEKESDKND